ncbi:adenylate/guanylate cyclase domain-containing protein [Leptospira bandrabouensis]|uniref:Adenylate/guanylate cyclase domain-containing protein n=1 Tax=Leptospira bandrabouensis TaxID=2484903 RepID=A0A6H3NQ44_9LEPT|nr:adenylate/guanylate cyclase domain-containing protein [Leptospira bandrabouensis]MCG6145063.1 adenylate/guanylate cyclase domain-containing protein [Leptospira bandrabouensis]MCG6153075.1 adenylate/guanylate cyclase domain-containing protein [Leptospira bandrabouensis]MCG6160300.1 adenylate/guanylate cyclase domain-containing protein [Leptospira bandrabouensis]MCG6164232.1 adenylate/guanylate cyclase domain-containing protein [Leptospira bandrabouensis]MCW7459263.1 adenylate/guanylate cycla
MKWIYLFLGDPKKHSLEHRLFNTVSLINGLLNLLGVFGVLYLENYQILISLNVGSGLLMLAMYYLSRVKSIYFSLYWPFNLTILFYLASMWFFNGGSVGGNHYYLIPSLVIALILIRNHNIWVVYSIYIGVSASLYIAEYFHRDWIVGYANEMDRYLDAGGNYLFVQILTGILIFILSRNLNIERKKSETLLLNILPESIAEELKREARVIPKRYEVTSVLFCDMAGFTKIAEKMNAEELVGELDTIFREFDRLCKEYKLEKIKTIGDAYMAVGGVPEENQTNSVDAVLCGLMFQQYMAEQKEIRSLHGREFWEIRLGIHSGPLVAGVVGTDKFAYDVWGDTVNTASRLESSGVIGEVNISSQVFEEVKFYFECEPRGFVSIKNKADIEMYLVKGFLPEYADPNNSKMPNALFKRLYESGALFTSSDE